jgi:hypothetical protein
MGVEVRWYTEIYEQKGSPAQNFDVFLDVFLLSINPRMSEESDPVESQEPQEDKSWHVFNALCQKVHFVVN